MHVQTDIPGATLWAPASGELSLDLHVLPEAPAAPDAAVARAWATLCAENPRLFAGPMLSVTLLEAVGPARARIICRPDTYDRLAVRPGVDTGVRLLAVTGLLFDPDGRLLLAQRSLDVHAYPGHWEVAPAGGVEPLEPGRALTLTSLCDQLQTEFVEEFGLGGDTPPLPPAQCVAIVRDDRTFSDDIVFRVELLAEHVQAIEQGRSLAAQWEYDRLNWLSREDARTFVARNRESIIPPTLALLRWLHWA